MRTLHSLGLRAPSGPALCRPSPRAQIFTKYLNTRAWDVRVLVRTGGADSPLSAR